VGTECEAYLEERVLALTRALDQVEALAARDELPEASIDGNRLKLAPMGSAVPEEAEQLMRRAYALIPHVKITDLLLEVDQWTGFTDHVFGLLQHLSPLGWDHITLTGDYTWKAHRAVERGHFRALRPLTSA
jgi:hypothetical protein